VRRAHAAVRVRRAVRLAVPWRRSLPLSFQTGGMLW
jgi:hypothetical protein